MMIATRKNLQNYLGQLITDVNKYKVQMLNQPTTKLHHADISIDEYFDHGHYQYKVLFADEDMSTYDPFQEKICEDNVMEEPSLVSSTIIIVLVNDEATKSTTSYANLR